MIREALILSNSYVNKNVIGKEELKLKPKYVDQIFT